MSIDYYLLSARDIDRQPAFCCVIELEDVIINCLKPKILIPSQLNEILNNINSDNRNILISTNISIYNTINMLNSIDNYLNRFDDIYVYIFDAILSTKEINTPEWKKNYQDFLKRQKKYLIFLFL